MYTCHEPCLLLYIAAITMAEVLREIKGNVGVAVLNRPKKLNAWTGQMQTEQYDTFQVCCVCT